MYHRLFANTPLRIILIVLFVVQITLAVSLTAWLSIRNGQKAVERVVDNLWYQITARTMQCIDEYTQIPEAIIADTLANQELTSIDLTNPNVSTRYLWYQMSHHHGSRMTAIGYETGQGVMVERTEDGQWAIGVIDPGQTQLQSYALSAQGDRGQQIGTNNFNLKSQSWYQDALRAGQLTWTDGSNSDPPLNILRAARPIYHSETHQPIGVTQVTMSLKPISNFLGQLQIGRSSQIFILNTSGNLVASSPGESHSEMAETGESQTRPQLKAIESSHARIRQTTEHLIEKFDHLHQIQQVENTKFITNGQWEIVQITPFPNDLGLDWLIVIVAPEADIMAEINAHTRNTLWLYLGALALATGSSILTARWITAPLRRLNQVAKQIAQNSSLSVPEDITTSYICEVNQLTHSFMQMTQQIQSSFAVLQESEANFKNIAANVPGAIFRYILYPDGTDTVLYMSPGCYQLWEIEAHVVQENASILWEIVDPEDLPAMQASVMKSAQTLETWNCEWRITTPSGRRKWVQGIGQPSRNPDGSVLWHTVILDVSDRKAAQIQLQDLTNRLELATRSARMGIWDWDLVSDRLIWDDRMYELYGITPGDFGEVYEAWEASIHPDDLITVQTVVQQALEGEQDYDLEFRVVWPDRTVRTIECHAIVQRDAEGHPVRVIGVNLDISDRKQTELALEQELLLSKTLFNTSIDGIVLLDYQGNVLQTNASFAQMLGYTVPQTYTLNLADWDAQWSKEELQTILKGNIPLPPYFETRHRRQDGSIYDVEISYSREVLNGETVHFCICRNISDRKQAQEQLIYSALHDSLTDLPNRALLTNRLELSIQKAQQSPTYYFAVLFLDLDQFKVINDSLGHLIGDRLLLIVAQKLQSIIRPTDLAARLGGDEFVILLEHLPDLPAIIPIAERLLTEFNRATEIDGHSIFITTSIGIVWGTNAYTEASDLLRDADIALYRAKAKGRNRYEIFDTEMHVEAVKRMTLEHDLRVAIDQQEFIPYYQPIVDLNTRQLTGFEALIRWQHPVRGFISPADFIPIAEEIGLISAITQWILQSACEQMAAWQSQFPNLEDLRISINLSGQDLRQSTLVETIRQILTRTQLPATSLTLEITESLLIENIEATIHLLGQLRDLGIRISIDDFGTGYSSLSYLYNLPANYLKIDQSFVGKMQLGNKNYKIVQAVVSMSDQLQLGAIAEGIEMEQQLAWLQALGCEFGQGYFFSRPLTPTAATDLLATGGTLKQ